MRTVTSWPIPERRFSQNSCEIPNFQKCMFMHSHSPSWSSRIKRTAIEKPPPFIFIPRMVRWQEMLELSKIEMIKNADTNRLPASHNNRVDVVTAAELTAEIGDIARFTGATRGHRETRCSWPITTTRWPQARRKGRRLLGCIQVSKLARRENINISDLVDRSFEWLALSMLSSGKRNFLPKGFNTFALVQPYYSLFFGKISENVVYSPGLLFTRTFPWCASMMSLTMDKPIPSPSPSRASDPR